MGNKLFIIGGYYNLSCEVFDSFSRNFTRVKADLIKIEVPFNSEAVCVGNKIVVFCWQWNTTDTKVIIYDAIYETWSEKKIDIVNKLIGLSCVKYNSD